jgi:hypothetical protein
MKYIKTYEDNETKKWWYIDGDYENICKVIKNFLGMERFYKFFSISEFDRLRKTSNGCYITKTGKFWICHSTENKIKAERYIEDRGGDIAGELKLIDDILVKDTLYGDVRKYNL